MCLRVRRVEVRVWQVAIDYLSVVCMPECKCEVTRKVYEFLRLKGTDPRISRAVP